MELGRQSQGGGFFQEFRAHQQMGRLTLADIQSFLRRADRCRQVTVLPQTLRQNRAEGGVRIDDEDASRMAAKIIFSWLCHGSLDLSLDKTVCCDYFNTFMCFSKGLLPLECAVLWVGAPAQLPGARAKMGTGPALLMTALQHPDAIRHFQSLCDACQELAHRHHSPSELRLYADGYLHALRRTAVLDHTSQRRLEELIERWILDPSGFLGPDGQPRMLMERERH
jgi:hypothetical protein